MRNILLPVIVCITLFSCSQKKTLNTKLSGLVFGTSYSIVYNSTTNYKKEIDSIFNTINASLSTYQNSSIISKLNNNDTVIIDAHFTNVFKASKVIYKHTNGAFDPTIGVLVNAWDFGPKKKVNHLNQLKIDSLMLYVGFKKVTLVNGALTKPKETFLDFNAIAKGYAVDVVSNFLTSKQCNNHLVEIGGEIRVSGVNNDKSKPWRVGVEKPNFDGTQSLLKGITLHNTAMATSGTYRKFKVDSLGNRYAHIIDTQTGRPSKTNLLSISVIANNCMLADAYATAFKTMGIDAVKLFLDEHTDIKVFLIFEKNKQIQTLSINGFPEA